MTYDVVNPGPALGQAQKCIFEHLKWGPFWGIYCHSYLNTTVYWITCCIYRSFISTQTSNCNGRHLKSKQNSITIISFECTFSVYQGNHDIYPDLEPCFQYLHHESWKIIIVWSNGTTAWHRFYGTMYSLSTSLNLCHHFYNLTITVP